MRRLLTVTLVLGLATVGCAAGEGATTTSAAVDSPTTADTPDTTDAPETTTTAEKAATTTAVVPTPGGDDCLVGTWTLDTEAFIENFDSIMAEAGMADTEVTALGGTFTVEMNSDGTYLAIRDGWGFNMVSSEGTVTIEINGDESGTWSADGSTLTINPGESDLTVDAFVEVDGQVVPLPGSQVPIETPPGLATDSEFECSGDVITLTNDGVESVMNRN